MPKKGYKQTEEHRQKCAELRKGKKLPPHSEEDKRKAVETRMKNGSYFHSIETRKKIGKALLGNKNGLGYKFTDEQRKDVSIRNMGKKQALGYKQTLEQRIRHSEVHSGEKHWNWKGGITKERFRIRNSLEYRLWRESVFKRDDWRCQKCRIKSGHGVKAYIQPHHILNFSSYPMLRFTVKNGITLCEKCHKLFHKTYGNRNNNEQQVDKFLNKQK